MTAEDKPRFFGLLTAMFDMFRSEVTPVAEHVYWTGLEEFPWPVVQNALVGVMHDGKFFHHVPLPGDLRERCGAVTPDVLLAQLQETLRRDYFGPTDQTPDLVRRLIRSLGGWRHVTELPYEQLRARVYQAAPQLIAQTRATPERVAIPVYTPRTMDDKR